MGPNIDNRCQMVAPAAWVGFILIGLLLVLTKMGYTVGRGL
jgi:hypothetical protein